MLKFINAKHLNLDTGIFKNKKPTADGDANPISISPKLASP